MKKLLLLLFIPALFSFMNASTLTKPERKFAIEHLKKTQKELIESVKGLSEAQLNFKPAPDRWSVLQCVQHITLASPGIWQGQQAALKQPNDSNWKAGFTDEMVIKMIEDRSHKAQAPEPFKPIHAEYKNLDEPLKAFNEDRSKLIKYVETSDDDMHAHFVKAPFGVLDCYQMILLISAHTNRHMQQLNEVKADANFPKE